MSPPYTLSVASRVRLRGVQPVLVAIVERAIEITEQDFTVYEGVRTRARQREYMARGVSRTLHSKHLLQPDGYGHAVDLVPWIGGRARWEWPAIYPIAAAMAQAARGFGVPLRWGGVWDRGLGGCGQTPDEMRAAVLAYTQRHPGPDFLDGPHYELIDALIA